MVNLLRDSRKPWAVLHFISRTGQILPRNTRYFWTRVGAERYAYRDSIYRLKVVRNR